MTEALRCSIVGGVSRSALLALTLAALFAATFTTTAPAAIPAHAAKKCNAPKYPGLGYFTGLNVTGVGCATGQKLVVNYYKCRIKHGKAGRCTTKVLGFSCREVRNSIPTEIDARVTCRKGRQTITHTYQQDL